MKTKKQMRCWAAYLIKQLQDCDWKLAMQKKKKERCRRRGRRRKREGGG